VVTLDGLAYEWGYRSGAQAARVKRDHAHLRARQQHRLGGLRAHNRLLEQQARPAQLA
jgi:hypothetical protein